MDPYYLLVTAISLASIYGLLAIGISIICSSLGMITLPQAFIFPSSAYAPWLVPQNISPNGFVVVAAGVITGALAGALTGVLAFIPLYDKPNFALRSLIATLAISLMGGQCLLWMFTTRVKALPKIFGIGSVHIGPATVSYDKIGAIVCSTVLLLLTLGWMKSSRRRLEIRAMMQNPKGSAPGGFGLRSTPIG